MRSPIPAGSTRSSSTIREVSPTSRAAGQKQLKTGHAPIDVEQRQARSRSSCDRVRDQIFDQGRRCRDDCTRKYQEHVSRKRCSLQGVGVHTGRERTPSSSLCLRKSVPGLPGLLRTISRPSVAATNTLMRRNMGETGLSRDTLVDDDQMAR